MTNSIFSLARLATGLYTPFLASFWGEAESAAANAWFDGVRYPDAVQLLEQRIASGLEGKWSVSLLDSGRSAIQVALEALNLPKDSEVLVPTFSCVGVIMPVIQAGLQPVLVDVDAQFNVRLESLLEADGPRVRAIIVSHLSGCWAQDMDGILKWAKGRGIFVIDDAAQAQGLVRNGKAAGTCGDIGIFSSGLGKMIFGPFGGWAVTLNPKIASSLRERALAVEPRESVAQKLEHYVVKYSRSNSSQGRRLLGHMIEFRKNKYLARLKPDSEGLGRFRFSVNTMSEIGARLTLLQIEQLDVIIARRRLFAARWREMLQRLGLASLRMLPDEANVYCKMLLSFEGEQGQQESRSLSKALWDHGVEVEPSYTPLHLRAPFSNFRRTSMHVVDKLWRGAFSVPVRPNLNSNDWARIDTATSRFERHA